MNPKLRIAGMVLLIAVGVSLCGWGGVSLCHYIAHENAMIASVKDWDFKGNFHKDAYSYMSYYTISHSHSSGYGKYRHTYTTYDHIPYVVNVPARDWSEWSGVDAEGVTRHQTRDKYVEDQR